MKNGIQSDPDKILPLEKVPTKKICPLHLKPIQNMVKQEVQIRDFLDQAEVSSSKS